MGTRMLADSGEAWAPVVRGAASATGARGGGATTGTAGGGGGACAAGGGATTGAAAGTGAGAGSVVTGPPASIDAPLLQGGPGPWPGCAARPAPARPRPSAPAARRSPRRAGALAPASPVIELTAIVSFGDTPDVGAYHVAP